eukprot:m.144240 g.144240  ORF g.144240 m.144240 type:complete len:184 (-) comp23020_c0_seq2:1465-2016(-)
MSEIREAAHLLVKLVRRQLDDHTRDTLTAEIINRLESRIIGHWYPLNPNRGSGHRCILISAGKVDPVLVSSMVAARLVQLESAEHELALLLPTELAVWVDPGDVSVRLGNEPVWSVSRSLHNSSGGSAAIEIKAPTCTEALTDPMTNSPTMSISAPSFCPSTIVSYHHGQTTMPTTRPYIMAR